MKKYAVTLNVVIDVMVEAENEDDASYKAIDDFYKIEDLSNKNIIPLDDLDMYGIEEIEEEE